MSGSRRRARGSIPSREALMSDQKGRCAACGLRFGAGILAPHRDHRHHGNRAVRGLLHAGCNQALGMARESPSVLRALAAYLDLHEPGRDPSQPRPVALDPLSPIGDAELVAARALVERARAPWVDVPWPRAGFRP